MSYEELKAILDEIFEDEIYDMADSISMAMINRRLLFTCNQFRRGTKVVTFRMGDWLFKINNSFGGFVSCSSSDKTAVSNTLYMAFPDDGEHDEKECFKNLLDMMNEAWYSCTH